MMIKTPVKRHEMFTSSFVDKFGCFLDDAQMNDAQKRINMHDELVAAVKELKVFYDDRMASNKEYQLSKEINELLGRCK